MSITATRAVKKRCCDKKNNDSCCSTDEIEKDLLSGYSKLCQYADLEIREKKYGHKCEEDLKNKCNKLSNLLETLESENKKISLGLLPCLSCESLNKLREKIRNITGKNCGLSYSILDVDLSEEETWKFNNPSCFSYDYWNKWSSNLITKLGLDLTLIKDPSSFTFEVSREIIPSDVFVALSVVKESNDLELEVKRTIEESKIDFELLIEKVNLDFDLTTYLKLVKNNITFDIVKTIYESNLSLEISQEREDDEILLVTKLSKYPLSDITLDTTILSELGRNSKINKEHLKKDYN